MISTLILRILFFLLIPSTVFAQTLIINPTTGKLDFIGAQNATDLSSSLCSANQILKKNAGDTAWACAADNTTPGSGSSLWTYGGNEDDVVYIATLSTDVALGITSPKSSVILELSSTNEALLVTRINNNSTFITSPRNGMIAYDSSENQLEGYINGTWVDLGASASGGDEVLIDGVGVSDASGVDLQGGSNITITFNAGASPDTASFAVDDSFVLNTGDTIAGSLTTTNLTIITSFTATGLVGDEDLQSEDFGDFTCAGEDACTLDANTVADNEIDYTNVTLADLTDDVGYEEETHVSEHESGGDDVISLAGLAVDADDVAGDTSDDDDLDVAAGGTGVSTFTANGAIYGNTASDLQVTAAHTANGSLLIGDGSGVPTVATITGGNDLTVTNGAGSITLDVDDAFIQNDVSDTITGTLTADGFVVSTGNTLDASGGRIVLPTEATPATPCRDGNIVYDSNATSGQRIYVCEGGSWVLQGDGGAGGGDSVTVNSTAVDTTADFADTTLFAFDITDGGAGGPDTVTGTLVAVDSPTDEECVTYEATGNTFEFQSCGGASSGYEILYPGSAFITGTLAIVGDATQGAQIDGSNGGVLLFDASTDEGAAWRFRLPDNWASHTDVKVMYSAASATSGTVEFEIAIMCQTNGDSERDDADGFAAIAVASDTVPGTARFPDTVTITPTDDSCAASDLITIFLSTDADDGTNDTATGDRHVLGVVYEYGL